MEIACFQRVGEKLRTDIFASICICPRFTDIRHMYVCSGHIGLRNEGHSLDTWPRKMSIFSTESYPDATV